LPHPGILGKNQSKNFPEIESNGKEGKIHCDFVLRHMSEAAICHVVLHLTGNSFRFYATSAPTFNPLPGSESFTGFEALASQRTSLAVPSLIAGTLSNISARRSSLFGSYAVHVLPHGTNIIVLIGIIVKALRLKRVGSITGTLLFMEEVVFDKGFYRVLFHETVVLFRTVTGVCHTRGEFSFLPGLLSRVHDLKHL